MVSLAAPGKIGTLQNVGQVAVSERSVAEFETLISDVGDLRAFCLVADLRSLTAAARFLGESKATVSRRIARLEHLLDVELLRRNPRRVEPTEDGAAYRLRVGEILELLGDANMAVRGERATPSGKLRVTAPPEFGAMLAPHFTAFHERFPGVHLDLVISQQILDFDADHLDLAFRVVHKLPDSPLIAHKLIELEGYGVASPGYLAAHRPPKRPADLAKHRLVLLSVKSGRVIRFRREDGNGPDVELRPAPSMVASDMNFVKELALAGAGIAWLPLVAMRRELDEGRLVAVLRPWVVGDAALYLLHGRRFLAPKVRVFRDFMLDTLAVQGRRHGGSAPQGLPHML